MRSLLCKTCISFPRRLAMGFFMADEEQILSVHVIIMQAKWGNTFICSTVKSSQSSHLYLYSAFNNTNCNKALHNIKIGKFVNNVK